MHELSQEELREILDYNPLTGLFIRRKGLRKGEIAGHKHKKGYVFITVNYKRYVAHQLAFLYMEGYIPKEIDHDNRIKYDNKWLNLKACTHSQNQHNRDMNSNNASGTTGVYWSKSQLRWVAVIEVESKRIWLGVHKQKEDAARARRDAEVKYNGV